MLRAKGHVFPHEGNKLWPLPADYPNLSVGGRRLARANACRMQQTPELAVHAWNFFCHHYLRPWRQPDGELYNPCFYEEVLPPAVYHRRMIWGFEKFARDAEAFPRGGGKTTNATSYALWKLITVPQWMVASYQAKFKPLVVRFADKLKTQIESNPRIGEDFGDLKPRKGSGAWSNDYIRLANFASWSGFSIDGKLRGPRASFILVDDVEYDPEGGRIPTPEDIEAVKHKITVVLSPMLRWGCHMAIIGTLFHSRCLLAQILRNDDPDSPDFDARFASTEAGGVWRKVHFGWEDEHGRNLWPEMYTPEFLEQQRILLGPAGFSSEYANKPISAGDAAFHINATLNEYTVEDYDDDTYEQPFTSDAIVRWAECSGSAPVETHEKTRKWRDHVAEMFRAITVDPIRNPSATSDYAVICVGGVDSRNDLWLLDMWVGKYVGAGQPATNTNLCRLLWTYIVKWRPYIVGIESVGFTEEFYHQADQFQSKLIDTIGYAPQCVPLRPPTNLAKGQRINRLGWRFPYGKIKYPRDRAHETAWSVLYDQTSRFTEDLGNLPHDDAIDTVEMLQQVFKGRKGVVPPASVAQTPVERFLDGERTVPGTDIPLLTPYHLMTADLPTLDRILDAARKHRDFADDSDGDAGYEETEFGEIT